MGVSGKHPALVQTVARCAGFRTRSSQPAHAPPQYVGDGFRHRPRQRSGVVGAPHASSFWSRLQSNCCGSRNILRVSLRIFEMTRNKASIGFLRGLGFWLRLRYFLPDMHLLRTSGKQMTSGCGFDFDISSLTCIFSESLLVDVAPLHLPRENL